MKNKLLLIGATAALLMSAGATSVSAASVHGEIPSVTTKTVDKNGQIVYTTISYNHSAKAVLSNVKVVYNYKNKNIVFNGQTTSAVKKVILQNGKQRKSFNVKKNKFTANMKFGGYPTFKLYGVNAKGKKITKTYSYAPSTYTTDEPVLVSFDRSHNKNVLKVSAVHNSRITVSVAGKPIKTVIAKSKQTTITLPKVKKWGKVTVVAKKLNRKTSYTLKVPRVTKGITLIVSY